MAETFAIHLWDSGNGEADVRLLVAEGSPSFEFEEVSLVDPRVPEALDRLFLHRPDPVRRAFERRQEEAISELLGSIGLSFGGQEPSPGSRGG